MNLIDPDTVALRDDQISINNGLVAIERRRIARIDILDEPYCRSRIAWKIATLSNAVTHRFVSLADGVALSWNNDNILSAVLNARALVETTAIYREFSLLLNKIPLSHFKEINDLAMNYLFSTRDEQILKEHPELKARQVLNAIDQIDKTEIPHFRSHYDSLSEMCHPNSLGHRALFSKVDRKSGITDFTMARDDRYLLPIQCSLGTAIVFINSLDIIQSKIPDIAGEHHRLHPSPLAEE